jgi:hypothetical protein
LLLLLLHLNCPPMPMHVSFLLQLVLWRCALLVDAKDGVAVALAILGLHVRTQLTAAAEQGAAQDSHQDKMLRWQNLQAAGALT